MRKRVLRWLHRHGYIEEREREERSNEVAEPTALEGCAGIAFSKGTFARLRDGSDADSADADESRAYEPKRRGRYTVELEGFNRDFVPVSGPRASRDPCTSTLACASRRITTSDAKLWSAIALGPASHSNGFHCSRTVE